MRAFQSVMIVLCVWCVCMLLADMGDGQQILITPGGGSSLSGLTTNKIQKAVSSSNIGDSGVTDDGTTVTSAENVTLAAGKNLVITPAATSQAFQITSPTGAAGDSFVGLYPNAGTNTRMAFQFIPRGNPVGNGAAANTQMTFFNTDFKADQTNTEYLVMFSGGTYYRIGVGSSGTGVVHNLELFNNGFKALIVDTVGHVELTGAAPTISACGTTPSLGTGDSDNAGTITVGTGAGIVACTATFGGTFAKTPSCTVSTNSFVASADINAVSTTAVTFGLSAAFASGKIYYHCF